MITTLIIIYLVSVIGFYKINQKIETNNNISNFIAMIFPLVNTVLCVVGIFIILGDLDWNKFFNRW